MNRDKARTGEMCLHTSTGIDDGQKDSLHLTPHPQQQQQQQHSPLMDKNTFFNARAFTTYCKNSSISSLHF
jgi:hypothetical protein